MLPKPCPQTQAGRIPIRHGGYQGRAGGQGAVPGAWCRRARSHQGKGCARGSAAEGQHCLLGADKRR